MRDHSLDIAVTGLAARFPGSPDLAAWWSAIKNGRVLTTRYSRQQLLDVGVPADLVDDPDYVPVGGRLADVDRFDNVLFRVSARDAELMDPQHRLMLEVAWAALEDAAVAPLEPADTTGVFASMTGSGYTRAMLVRGALDPLTLDQVIHGTEPDFMASRIAYKLGLTGPTLAVQTACSSSLVGVHLAVQALVNGDCDQALVIGAGMNFPQAGHLHTPGGVLSPSGHCRPFDERADGVVAGSGVACVVLRRLEDALGQGPEPYGVVLGTAINNDGSAKAGYYAPSADGQEAVIRAALRVADVTGDSIGYLETHGTGTRVGDPIEWSAASAALGAMGAQPGQVAVGALKANVGHLDAAAGVSALIKALMVVRDGIVPPVAGFTRANPLLETEGSPLYVPAEAAAWRGPEPRRAGVSAFGIGGTNVHLVVEQAPPLPAAPRPADEDTRLVVLSAADPAAVTRAAARLGGHLASVDVHLADVARTLATGRAALPERLAVTGRTAIEVADRLAAGEGVVRGRCPADGPAPVVFLFPGQGAQRPGMAQPFVHALPGFAAALDDCLGIFDAGLAGRLRRALLDATFPAEELRQTELAQPALFTVEYAAATALSALGVTPAALVGHSLGEITAACVAGVLDLPDAARFVVVRGRAMRECPTGAMLAVACDEDETVALVAESGLGLELAAVNAAHSCVVAGTVDVVEKFRCWLGARVFTRILRTSHAFHSSLIEPAVPRLRAELAGVGLRRAAIPFASNVTGRIVPVGGEVGSDTFAEQVRRPVRYADAKAEVARRFPGAVLVEVGPGRTLSALVDDDVTVVPLSPGGTASAGEEPTAALGVLWTLGQPVDLAALCGEGRPIRLPGYAFRGPKWIAPEVTGAPAPSSEPTTAGIPASPSATKAAGRPPDARALLGGLWAELLGRSDLSENSDFFELGGDSLLVTHLARRLNQELGIRVPLRGMLAGRTLGRQTAIVLGLLQESLTPTHR